MVLYYRNGRVVKAHEDYLEREAAKKASETHYMEQIDVCKNHRPSAGTEKRDAFIVIKKQEWYTLYVGSNGRGAHYERLTDFDVPQESEQIPVGGIDRATLMKCSTFADEYFRYHNEESVLRLPIEYPRKHQYWVGGGKYENRDDDQMAYIRPDEVGKFIVPWLREMEGHFEKLTSTSEGKKRKNKAAASVPHHEDENGDKSGYDPVSKVPSVTIPGDLLEKIHLYNCMLQLGLPSFIQRPLIDALVRQMYRTNLSACHLETLEMTVARFYSLGVAVLDPVLCHLVGTYPFRSAKDRHYIHTDEAGPEESLVDAEEICARPAEEQYEATKGTFDFSTSRRKLLEYAEHPGGRKDYPHDTFIMPPKLPVLGHSLRHWSGVRRNGTTAVAFTGYPLNVGRARKFYRRRATDALRTARRNRDYVEYGTYRMKDDEHYHDNPPGDAGEAPAPAGEPTA